MQTVVLPRAFAVEVLGAILTLASAFLLALLILNLNAVLALVPSAREREKLLVSPLTMQVGTAGCDGCEAARDLWA
jgi:hypothetical protein